MSKYFTKSFAVFLTATIYFMASGVCVNSLLNFKIETQVVKASSMSDNCTDDNSTQAEAPAPMGSHHNSVLPCCVGENHPSVLTVFQSVEISKYIPVSFFSENQILKHIPETVAYNSPIFAPPELFSLQSTILRI